MSLRFFMNLCILIGCIGVPGMALACAPSEPSRQVIVQFTQALENKTDIARKVSQATGLKASFVSSISPLIHAVKIECTSLEACEAALQHMQKDPFFSRAEWDHIVHHCQTSK